MINLYKQAHIALSAILFLSLFLHVSIVRAQCCSNGVNLLSGNNPDFSAPFTTVPPGFSTDNTYSSSAGPGNYTIITSRNYGACAATPQFDHTSGDNTGKYLWFDTPGGATAANPAVAWQPFTASNPPGTQNLIQVTPNTVYVFSVWIRDLARTSNCIGGGAPIMGLRINGVDMAEIDLGLVTSPCCPQWTYLCAEWNSGTATTADIQIESRTGNGFTDLGIDDVYFGTTSTNLNGVLGNDTNICTGQTLLLQPSLPGATAVLWSDGSTGNSLTVNAAGTYWVQATISGCTGRDTIVVTQGTAPTVSLGTDQNICAITYDIIPAVSGGNPLAYLWQDGTTAPTLTANATGLYWVQVSNGCGSVRDSIALNFSSAPLAFSLGNDTVLCTGQTLTLSYLPNPTETLLWQDGSTGNSYSVSMAGVYSLRVTNACGTVSDTVAVTYSSAPQLFTLGNDTAICAGSSLVLGPNPAVAGAYQWHDNSSGNSYTVNTLGTYSLTISNNCGSSTDVITVGIQPLPLVDAGGDTAACATSLQLAPVASNVTSYIWSEGSTTNAITVSATGLYSVTVANQCGVASDDIQVSLYDAPTMPFNNLLIDTCTGAVIEINALNPGAEYNWSTADTTQALTLTASGVYNVTITNGPCSVTDGATLNYHNCTSCKAQIPTAFSPNGDNVNDYFKPIFTCNVSYFEIRIYNRWGELVFITNDAMKGWDGNYKGMKQPLGTYVYYTEYKFSDVVEKQAQQGNVTLLR